MEWQIDGVAKLSSDSQNGIFTFKYIARIKKWHTATSLTWLNTDRVDLKTLHTHMILQLIL